MDIRDAQKSIEHLYRKIYCSDPGAVTHRETNYTLTYSGVTWLHSINQLWLHNTTALNDDVLATAKNFFRGYNADFSVAFVEADTLPTVRWLTQRHYVERSADPIYGLCGLP